jgi:hypothetical protein
MLLHRPPQKNTQPKHHRKKTAKRLDAFPPAASNMASFEIPHQWGFKGENHLKVGN